MKKGQVYNQHSPTIWGHENRETRGTKSPTYPIHSQHPHYFIFRSASIALERNLPGLLFLLASSFVLNVLPFIAEWVSTLVLSGQCKILFLLSLSLCLAFLSPRVWMFLSIHPRTPVFNWFTVSLCRGQYLRQTTCVPMITRHRYACISTQKQYIQRLPMHTCTDLLSSTPGSLNSWSEWRVEATLKPGISLNRGAGRTAGQIRGQANTVAKPPTYISRNWIKK